MRRQVTVLGSAAVLLLAAGGMVFGIANGTPDGTAHPAIGLILATNDSSNRCAGNHQFIGSCSATLIAPDLALTTGDCASAFGDAVQSGLVNEVWIIFDENPVAPSGSPFDCNKFTDVDETQIVTNPAYLASPFDGANMGVMRLSGPLSIPPVQLPIENRLQNVPRGLDRLTAVAMGATSRPTGGFFIFETRRRSWLGRTDPPLDAQLHPVALDDGGSPAQACFGSFSDGGVVFVGDTNEVVSLTRAFSPCSPLGRLPRLDTPEARAFLDDYVTVP